MGGRPGHGRVPRRDGAAAGPAVPEPPDPPAGTLVPAAAYLSGNVRRKLRAAERAALDDPRFRANAGALREVIPPDLGPEDIAAQLGAPWIDADDVRQFLSEILQDRRVKVRHPGGAHWKITGTEHGVLATQTWGTDRYAATELAEKICTQKPIQVYDHHTTPSGSYSVLNIEETLAAQEKADQLRERFSEWAWEDPGRADHLIRVYNDTFNSTVLRSYDGVTLTLPGLASWFRPLVHPHQHAAVARQLAEPSTGLFHEVGAGKTAEMVMGVMEMRRLHMIRKPMIAVPNHMVEQFAREFVQLYPQAKVLVTTKKDLEAPQARRLFTARCATGNWDAIIIAHSVFERVPLAPAQQRADIDARVAHLRTWEAQAAAEMNQPGADAAEKAERKRTFKQMQSAREAYEERLKAKLSKNRDAGITMEALGVDYLCYDEAHLVKNLMTPSNIRDAAISGSDRASHLHMVLDWLRGLDGRHVATLATATPIANSITEIYVMLQYLAPHLLEAAGITDFDSWAATFGQVIISSELRPRGRRQHAAEVAVREVQEHPRAAEDAAHPRRHQDRRGPEPARPPARRPPRRRPRAGDHRLRPVRAAAGD